MYPSTPVVVAVDDSAPSGSLVDWAAEEAVSRQVELVVCHVAEWDGGETGLRSVPPAAEPVTPEERIVVDAIRRVRAVAPDLSVRGLVGHGRVSRTLVDVSDEAGLLAVGARGTGGLPGLRLGSVSAQLAAHAHAPVAVVHAGRRGPRTDVVVGVDGSPASVTALEFAADRARSRAGTVVALHAYRPPTPEPGPVAELARRVLDRAVDEVERFAGGVRFERRLVIGTPAAALVRQAADAEALVVGARGVGGFAGLVLGSVSQQVVRHAPGVVIVAR